MTVGKINTLDVLTPAEAAGLISDHAELPSVHHFAPKVKLETRAMNAASGDVSYTGYGFQPVGLLILSTRLMYGGSIGSSEPALAEHCLYRVYADSEVLSGPYIIWQQAGSLGYQNAVLKTYDADGFTLTWVKSGTATGDFNFLVFAFK